MKKRWIFAIVVLIFILGFIISAKMVNPPDYFFMRDMQTVQAYYNMGETCKEYIDGVVWKNVKTEEHCHSIDYFTVKYLVFVRTPDGTPDCQWVTYNEPYCNNRFNANGMFSN